jgi:hypothetical protein
VLEEVARRTGGKMLREDASAEDIFVPDREPRSSSRSVADLFLAALACLVTLDVGVRRIQLDWKVMKGWFGFGPEAASTATMGALLKRKRSIGLARGSKAPERPARGVMRGRRAAGREPQKPAPPGPAERETKPGAEDVGNGTTTGRLLARKKKWKQE